MQFSNRYRLLYSTIVLLFAACLRLGKIAEVPPGLHDDEAFFLIQAQRILQGKAFPIFIAAHGGSEPLFTYLCSLALAILGPVTWAGRLIAAWAGLLGVAITIRVGNEMFPRRNVGALAGLILAGLFWHLTLSRYGIQSTIAAMAAAATMAALWYGVRTRERRGYLLAGVCLGIGLYSYSAFRLFPLVPLYVGLALLLTERGRRRTLLASGLMAGSLALLIYAPLAWYFIQNPNWFFARYNEATAATLGAPDAGRVLLNNAAQMIEGLLLRGDERWWHNIAFRPMLDSAQAPFFMLGLLFCLRRWRRPDSWALLAWLAVGLLPSILTERPPDFGRIIMVTPALALLMALGIQTAWEWSRGRLAHGLVVLAVGLSLGLTVRDLFGRWADDPHLFSAFEIKDVWIGQALRATPTGSDLYTTPMHVEWFHDGFFMIEYLIGDEAYSRLRTFNGLACLVMPAFTSAPTTYAIVSPEDKNTLPALEAAFPGATHRTVNWHEGCPTWSFTRFRLDRLRTLAQPSGTRSTSEVLPG